METLPDNKHYVPLASIPYALGIARHDHDLVKQILSAHIEHVYRTHRADGERDALHQIITNMMEIILNLLDMLIAGVELGGGRMVFNDWIADEAADRAMEEHLGQERYFSWLANDRRPGFDDER